MCVRWHHIVDPPHLCHPPLCSTTIASIRPCSGIAPIIYYARLNLSARDCTWSAETSTRSDAIGPQPLRTSYNPNNWLPFLNLRIVVPTPWTSNTSFLCPSFANKINDWFWSVHGCESIWKTIGLISVTMLQLQQRNCHLSIFIYQGVARLQFRLHFVLLDT